MIHLVHKHAKPKVLHRANPARALVLGFAVLILIGTLLLSVPGATRTGKPSLTWNEALFTATSAVCVTGLSVFDPGSTLTMYGQVVLLCLIQVGGLGFMTLTAFFFTTTRRHLSLEGEVILRESLNESGLGGLSRLTVRIIQLTALFEGIGALLCLPTFIATRGVGRGIFIAIFHAVSSFCNAGFDVLGNGDNLVPYLDDPVINIVTMVLIVLGGLGFFVILECCTNLRGRFRRWRHPDKNNAWVKPLSLNAKIVLTMTSGLLIAGFVIFLIAEGTNPATLGAPDTTGQEKILGSLFQSVSTRTAGFMTFQQGDMRMVSKIATVFLMFIGASPAGTAGGIKTTTAAAVWLHVWAILKGRRDVNAFHHRIPQPLINRAVATFTIGFLVVVLVSSAITLLEPHLELSDVIFECASAFGTVGLSTGITASLSIPSQILLVITMLGGRVGFFTLTVALAVSMSGPEPDIRYPAGRIMVG